MDLSKFRRLAVFLQWREIVGLTDEADLLDPADNLKD